MLPLHLNITQKMLLICRLLHSPNFFLISYALPKCWFFFHKAIFVTIFLKSQISNTKYHWINIFFRLFIQFLCSGSKEDFAIDCISNIIQESVKNGRDFPICLCTFFQRMLHQVMQKQPSFQGQQNYLLRTWSKIHRRQWDFSTSLSGLVML